jgi:hypothetical protein
MLPPHVLDFQKGLQEIGFIYFIYPGKVSEQGSQKSPSRDIFLRLRLLPKSKCRGHTRPYITNKDVDIKTNTRPYFRHKDIFFRNIKIRTYCVILYFSIRTKLCLESDIQTIDFFINKQGQRNR